MTILNRDEMRIALRDGTNDSIDETVDALYRALGAWRDWCLSSDGVGGERFDNAIELTAAAGIDMEGDDDRTDG